MGHKGELWRVLQGLLALEPSHSQSVAPTVCEGSWPQLRFSSTYMVGFTELTQAKGWSSC